MTIEKTVQINAGPSTVWEYLTNPVLIKQWMGEPEMKIEIITDWKTGSSIIIKGFHHTEFENKGTILQFAPHKVLQYTHLSSTSQLPDTSANHSIITFILMPDDMQTLLTVKVDNFATEVIFKHLEFYWNTTTEVIKRSIEKISM